MNNQYAQSLDHKLSKAIFERMGKKPEDAKALLADLAIIRSIRGRSDSGHLIIALTLVLKHLSDGHKDKKALKKELDDETTKVEETREGARAASSNSGFQKRDETIKLTKQDRKKISARSVNFKGGWHLPPVFLTTWKTLSAEKLEDAVELAVQCFGADAELKADLLSVSAGRATTLSCYPGYKLYELFIQPKSGPARSFVGLFNKKTNAIRCNGQSPPLHTINGNKGIDLSTLKNATEYLHLFCGLVHSDAGPFNIVVDKKHITAYYLEGEPSADVIKQLKIPKLHESEIENDDKNNDKTDTETKNQQWDADTTVMYSNALFGAKFRIQPTGMVEMLEDEPLLTDLPVVREGYLNGWRIKRDAGYAET